MSSLTHYQLLTPDIDENQTMEDYQNLSSSAPTIINSDLICKSRR